MIKAFGKSDLGRAGASATALALDLTDIAVTLYFKDPAKGWVEIASVPTEAPDFLARISDLRTEAMVRDETAGPITLWLPAEQILVRDYNLQGKGPEARHEARAKLAAETPYTPSELMVALAPQKRGQPTKVLGALCQTVIEARDYAEKWGFQPGAVSTRVAAEQFGYAGPVFRAPEPAPLRLARRAALAGLAACALGAALLGVYGVSQVVEPLVVPEVQRPGNSMTFAVVNTEDNLPALPAGLLRPASMRTVQTLAAHTSVVAAPETHNGTLTAPGDTPVHLAGAPELPIPKTRPALKVGAAPRLPQRSRPESLGTAAVLPPKRPVSLMRNAVDAVRDESRELAAVPTPAEAPSPSPAPTSEQAAESGSLVAAVLPTARRAPAPDEAAAGNGEAADESADEDLTPTVRAPEEIDTAPAPRPSELATPVPEPEDTSSQPATASLAAPAPSAEQTGTESEEEQVEDDEAPTRFAALSAPKPLNRPKSIETKPLTRQPSKSVARDNAPRTVRTAAAETGLRLGQTNLIGVLQGTNGRQALVRLSDGGYLKVSRGDVVDGWRVRSIGRETLRLSKSGQNRTLMLVSR